MREFDAERRAKLTAALGQKLYDGYHGVMLGMNRSPGRSAARSAPGRTLAYVPAETNYDGITAGS